MNTQQQQRRAVIVGGSLGGLFAATSLRSIGWDVDVFERSPHYLDSRGGGLVLQPDVLDAFRFGGIDYTGPLGVRSEYRQFLDARGEIAQRERLPQTQTAWSMLYGTLKASLPAGMIRSGVALTDIVREDAEVHARFSDGADVRADLLIGADGPDSTTRRLLLPGSLPAYAGYVAWRGLVPEPRLDAAAAARLTNAFTFQQEAGHQLLAYLIPGENGSTVPGERRWNWVWYRRLPAGDALRAALTDRHGIVRTHSIPPGAMSDAQRGGLLDDAAAHLAPALAALVAATDAPFMQIIQDYRAPRMAFGRAVLLGDAAFVARPHTGAGTAKAAANAVSLARALDASGDDVDRALAAWQSTQWRYGVQLANWGIALGERIMGDGDAARAA
ncbi:FAD-dependent monooxygenase [Burkholderia oklahomensis]|uniref:FAD binding domain protein n=1 Tax=Burkholderia oklahomensis TaxID=342113 RepID=A0AAI8BDQ3_9BURK|nr:FAD-dependent monooxygenase [Burkholderia oklahomensis]AIO70268.1 FAD binding domain protein [Burkholderia oklahomensis]AOI39971.1 hypothetical protein WG70_10305 [Burkholderia oklahomensis EO147]KUY62133.1 hypothetical protein WG70_05405 [Burkholderia oklahomensis EO147]QPS39667.1 FAD-dependent monooxygenase [Burkholderia oklahomensis]